MNKKVCLGKIFIICLLVAGAVCLNPFFSRVAVGAVNITDLNTCASTAIGANDVLTPGQVYRWAESSSSGLQDVADTIYVAGNLPILITVPHGGSTYATVSSSSALYLPDRSSTCGTVTTDVYTIDLALQLLKKIEAEFGGYPHMIINRLPRKKIDQNRTLTEECNPKSKVRGIKAWNDFHLNLKKKAVDAIVAEYGKGLYVDIHGKPDNYGASVHVGYHITSYDLTYNSDSTLNNESKRFINDSSLRFLYKNIKKNETVTLTNLLREDRSFGTILERYVNAIIDSSYSFHVAPRTDAKKPSPYYSGEYNLLHFCGATQSDVDYNVATYGNNYNDTNFLSGFQLETGLRLREKHLEEYAEKVTLAIKDYMLLNYGYTP